MASFDNVIKYDEMIIFDLRRLYLQHGYLRYKMNKFEEYDLYVRNKDFLISDGIITFTDTSGKLLALKPDVTLSIIKNARPQPGTVQKMCYNENVYRVSEGTHSFREIMQLGLECIGDIEMFNICEVIMLAAQSLEKISTEHMLNLSHLGVISAALSKLGLSDEQKANVIECIGRKSVHELADICRSAGAPEEAVALLCDIVSSRGGIKEACKALRGRNEEVDRYLAQLETVADALGSAGLLHKTSVDFSLINNTNYYNGIVFRGFIEGIPTAVLSGGQYDNLMRRLGKNAGAIGFAVYLDALERMHVFSRKYDVDALLLYDSGSDVTVLNDCVKQLTAEGMSVSAQRSIPDKLKYRKLFRLSGKEVREINEDA